MGERTLRTKTVFVFSYGELIRLTQDQTLIINSILPLGEDCLQISYTPIKETDECLKTTSLIHAAYTTAHGRLLLYKYLDAVGERAIYHDTDSICFLSVPGQPDPKLGQFLGDMTDQLADDYGPGSFITEFLAAGPKNYSYKTAVGGDLNNIKTVIKVRGISVNTSSAKTVTFETLKDMILSDEQKQTLVHIPAQIARLPGWRIVTRPSSKTWQVCLNKRRRIDKERTVAYGYQGTLLDDDDYDLLNTLALLYNE
ncbi:uncharacterized protein LOC113208067 [Frankliniella occidentalis]|uniref:Uncharacterized protein LOC113208067 n=1 Tax=Frankliniella occidentalis TaxID=133901 RepID=A0A6J1SHK1_FRAOC|nr:uncharacterized protein LOC113208067 [Frankliniella occidentalis]